ncbi:GGDEF-domain containing protein [Mycolicibacterium litorale]|nr:GGDEF-domain containing protein [Mycolicibacterium litorale]
MSKTARIGCIALGVFVAFVVWLLIARARGWTVTLVDDAVFTVLTAVATVSAALAARSLSGRLRVSWLALAVGLLGWTAGEIIWAVYEVGLHEAPFPSIADAGYLMMPIGACVALLLAPANRSTPSRGRLLLDGVIVAGSLFLVSWVTILLPLYHSGSTSRIGFVVSLAYPVSDIVVLTVAAVVLVRAGSEHRLSLTLLTAGLACISVSDSAFAYLSAKGQYATGNVIDIGWMAGLLLMTVAAVAGGESVRHDSTSVILPGWASVWLPYTPLLLAAVIAAAQPVPLLATRPVLTVAALLVVAVLARQFLAVSENRRLLAAVAEQAMHDPLTGLPNRALFTDRLDRAMRQHAQDGLPVGLVAVDLNDFKLVNDHLGHPVGDDLLIRVGNRLLNCVRAGDTVARLGGDEFAIVVDGGTDAADLVGQRVVQAFTEPFRIAGHELLIQASVGVAAAESGALSADELLRRADTAMYSAKRSRIDAVQTYTPEMQLVDDAADSRLLGTPLLRSGHDGVTAIFRLGKLRRAVEKSELTLVYQPKFDLGTGAVVGAEALLRWPQPDGGVLVPEDFLALVRRHGLMESVTQLVVNRALDDALAWHRSGVDVPVAVNIFAPSMANADLPDTIAGALAARGLDPAALSVEITEDLFLDRTECSRSVLQQLRDIGIRIAIDDFGSGYSALSYLRDLPIDEVKLDRDFITPILVDPRAAAVVRAVVELAHVLGLTIVAEGVEDAATASLVRDFGCDVGQGFYYSLPLPPGELLRLMTSRLSTSPPLR